MTRLEARALLGRQPAWALRNMARALQTMTALNNRADWKRLEALRALGYKVKCRIPGGDKEAKHAALIARQVKVLAPKMAELMVKYQGHKAACASLDCPYDPRPCDCRGAP